MWNNLKPGNILFKEEVKKEFLDSNKNVDWDKVQNRYQYLRGIKESLGNKYFTSDTRKKIARLTNNDQHRLLETMLGGLCNENSSVGIYATSPEDYEKFSFYMEPIIREYHNIAGDSSQKHDWNIPIGEYVLNKINPNFKNISMRARVARNVSGWNLPSSMDKKERMKFESFMEKTLSRLPFKGKYYSLTPGHKNYLSKEMAAQMQKDHYLFNDMTGDNHLTSSGIASDWPHGRGIWLSDNKEKMIWVGEEDQLRIISIVNGYDLGLVDKSLADLLSALESSGVKFAEHPVYGVVTTCPTNMGTGKRQSVLAQFPNLSERGTNETRLKKVSKEFGLQARGLSGEHSQMDSAGTTDISPLARFGVTEAEITKRLYDGLVKLYQAEFVAKPQ